MLDKQDDTSVIDGCYLWGAAKFGKPLDKCVLFKIQNNTGNRKFVGQERKKKKEKKGKWPLL